MSTCPASTRPWRPDGIDFAIIRENLEDLYLGLEGDTQDLAGLNLYSRHARANLGDLGPGKYAIKAITEAGSERVIRFAFELARKRDKQRKVTVTCKYNMLAVADGLFLKSARPLPKNIQISSSSISSSTISCAG